MTTETKTVEPTAIEHAARAAYEQSIRNNGRMVKGEFVADEPTGERAWEAQRPVLRDRWLLIARACVNGFLESSQVREMVRGKSA